MVARYLEGSSVPMYLSKFQSLFSQHQLTSLLAEISVKLSVEVDPGGSRWIIAN